MLCSAADVALVAYLLSSHLILSYLTFQHRRRSQIQELGPLLVRDHLSELRHHNIGQRRVPDHDGDLNEEGLVADLQIAEGFWREVTVFVHGDSLEKERFN